MRSVRLAPSVVAVALLSVVLSGPARAASEAYSDGATKQWFQGLASVYTQNCCDQADCHRTKSEYRDGNWWALSRITGEWVRIEPSRITATVSIFTDAVLCEGGPGSTSYVNGVSQPSPAFVYCFAPPPIGF